MILHSDSAPRVPERTEEDVQPECRRSQKGNGAEVEAWWGHTRVGCQLSQKSLSFTIVPLASLNYALLSIGV